MGLVQSHLNNRKNNKIKELETLNSTIEFLGHHKKICEQEIEKKTKCKENLDLKIHKCKTEYGKYANLDCKICFDNLIEIILIPCGHCYCEKCTTNMTHCYICQQQIINKYKIYKN